MHKTVADLLNHEIPEAKEQFHESMERLYAEVQWKSAGRNVCRLIAVAGSREKMIDDLHGLYLKNASANRLVESEFMRRLVTHSSQNEEHAQFVNINIVSRHLLRLTKVAQEDPRVRAWYLNHQMTVLDPEHLNNQIVLLSELPDAIHAEHSNKRGEVGASFLNYAQEKKWIEPSTVDYIVRGLSDEILLGRDEVPTNKDETGPYFLARYRRLLEIGDGKYKDIIQKSLEMGLAIIRKDLTFWASYQIK